jgi:hypothetical protein
MKLLSRFSCIGVAWLLTVNFCSNICTPYPPSDSGFELSQIFAREASSLPLSRFESFLLKGARFGRLSPVHLPVVVQHRTTKNILGLGN